MRRSDWPIIVGGCHRSGTSLIRRSLNAHPRIHCGPEVKFFRDFYGDYFDDPLDHLRFSGSARSLISEDDLLDVLGSAFVSIHEIAAKDAGKVRWADKAPENVLYSGDWNRILGNEWVMIHLVRNPLDTIASMIEAGFPLTFPPGLDAMAAMYRRYTEAGLHFGEKHPDRYRLIVYEMLVETPRKTLGDLMEWLGEDFYATQLRFNDSDQGDGLEDPKIKQTKEVHTRSIDRWRSTLRPEDASTIWTELKDLWLPIADLSASGASD